jgi:hypothetical protein
MTIDEDMNKLAPNEVVSHLTEVQQAAINLLATGYTIQDAAIVLGIAPGAIRFWINDGVHFRAALDEFKAAAASNKPDS